MLHDISVQIMSSLERKNVLISDSKPFHLLLTDYVVMSNFKNVEILFNLFVYYFSSSKWGKSNSTHYDRIRTTTHALGKSQ